MRLKYGLVVFRENGAIPIWSEDGYVSFRASSFHLKQTFRFRSHSGSFSKLVDLFLFQVTHLEVSRASRAVDFAK